MNEIDQLAERLKNVPYFTQLNTAELTNIVTSGTVKKISAGEYLFFENDTCAGMYVLIQGQVNLLKTGPDGQETILYTIKPVTMFNEVPVLDGGPNPVSARVTADSILWRINCDKFRQLLNRYPQVCIGMLSVLAKRNRMMLGHYVDLSFRSIPSRLAKQLLEISNNGKETIHRNEHPIRTIAARVVAAPEAISRTFRSFKDDGFINCDRANITVVDIAMLQKIAGIQP